MESAFDKKQVAWHIAADVAQQVSRLIAKSTRHFLDGHQEEWYHTLRAIRLVGLNHEIKIKQRKLLDKMELVIDNAKYRLDASNRRLRDEDKSDDKFYRKRAVKYKVLYCRGIELYQKKIMKLLKETGYLPAKKSLNKVGF